MKLDFDAAKQRAKEQIKQDLNALKPSSFLNLKRSSIVRPFLVTFLGLGLIALSMSFLTVGTAIYIKGLLYLVEFALAVVWINEIRLWLIECKPGAMKVFKSIRGYFNK